jgi:hypothetical protein
MLESNCIAVSSRGIMKSCDLYSSTPHSSIRQVIGYDFSKMRPGNTLYICSSAIPHFISNTFATISTPFILVTGDCDESCPNDLFRCQKDFLDFIESDKIIHWYSQNCVGSHRKLSQIPIGLDYHTLSDKNHEWGPKSSPIDQERLLFSVREKSKPIEERALKCYANFHFLMTTRFSQDRKDAIKKIPANCIYYEQSKVTRLRTWITQAQYAFVISPHGNGLDCHRTWEALALGCIPIVKSSPLDPMFAGLPVWIVKDWSEVNLSAMSCKIAEYKGRQVREKMQLSYWMGVILG